MRGENFCRLTVRHEIPALKQLAPAYEGVELGIGDAVLQKAIQGATGRSAKDVRPVPSRDSGERGGGEFFLLLFL